MKHLQYLIRTTFALMVIMTLFSCKDDEDNTQIPQNDAYYVKYEASSYFGFQATSTFSVNYTTENGVMKFEEENVGRSHSWDGTYGPFKKGDQIVLSIKCSVGEVTGRLYVSRNKEPFVIKAEGTKENKIELKYTIYY